VRGFFLSPHNAWIRYHDVPGDGPTCVYLHGLGSASSADFPDVITHPPLAGRRAVLVDLLGFGFSDRPADFSYTLVGHAHTVIALLDDLGLTDCALVGYSLGGSVAIALAAARPDLVSRLVMAEGNLQPGPEEGSNAVFSRAMAAQSEEAFLETGYRELLGYLQAEAPEFAGGFLVADPRAVHRTAVSLVASGDPTLYEQLLSLTMPRIYIFGQDSLQNEDMAERASRLPEQGVRVLAIPDAGHDMGTRVDFAGAIGAALSDDGAEHGYELTRAVLDQIRSRDLAENAPKHK
jgi:pimeloyl-ACP methyl ester carboxylesterase